MDKKEAKNKNQSALDKILQNDIVIYVIFFIILVICIFVVGNLIGLGRGTY
ncbi:MAG: hypothetical protein LUG24_06945 [Clostridiales bacterium]|nr:hypothetical protein [Clostridiales bacterium]